MNDKVKEIKQVNNDEVQVKFDNVVFDQLISLLQQLQLREAVKIKKIVLRRTESEGIVSADVVLMRAGA